jgi:uncharacterized protein DUF4011/restriction endonuclease-like protein/AAA domain-containing protein
VGEEVEVSIGGPETPEAKPELLLEVDAAPRASWAAEQCGIPIVRELRLTWSGAQPLKEAVLSLSIEPGLAPLRALPLPPIAPGATLSLPHPDLSLDGARLKGMSEATTGRLAIAVAVNGRELARVERPLEVLAANEWDGATLAELAAAFVLPGDPAIAEVLRRASSHRQSRVGEAATSADPRRDPAQVLALAESIFEAVRELSITLDAAPRTEAPGLGRRRVRSPSEIHASRSASAFDLTLLFAAALEAAGLHPWIVLFSDPANHALPAFWCDGDHLPVAATDDPGVVAKLLAAGRIVAFEAALACEAQANRPRAPATWRAAIDSARARLEERDAFELAIDVKAARLAQIAPLPITGTRGDGAPPPIAKAPRAADAAVHERTRVDRWKEQLLDLSLRNRLLHFVPSRSRSLALDLPGLADLEDRLHARPLVPVAEVALGGADPRAGELLKGRIPESERRQRLRERLERGDLPTRHRPADLEHRLVTLWRESRREIEETGTSTLELALGFLRWPAAGRTLSSERGGCLAPILLLPVELVRRGAGSTFELRLRDDEPRVNETLLEKLKSEFDVAVPGLDPLPADDHGIDVAAVLHAFHRALAVLRGFDVVEEAHVGFFSFAKFLLWRDLVAHEKELLGHDLVRHLVHGDRGAELLVSAPFSDARHLDRERPPESSRLVLDADGSQRVAIDAALRGRSFVLQGPPGTGKSQTIANLIAECLAAGKRVLFVAEKRAALDVVARRLERVGLGDLCLELHSQKASKRAIVAELAELLEAPPPPPPARAELAREVADLANALTAHADGLHATSALGPSHFACVERRLELADAPHVEVDWGDVLACEAATFGRRAQALAALADAAAPIADPVASPWHACRPVDWTPLVQQAVEQALVRFDAATARLAAAAAPVAQALGAAEELPIAAVAPLRALALLLGEGAPLGAWPLVERSGGDFETAVARVERAAALVETLVELEERVARQFGEGLYGLELAPLRAALARHAGRAAPLRWLALRRTRRTLAAVAAAPLPKAAPLIELLDGARQVLELRGQLGDERPFLDAIFGAPATGASFDAATLRAAAAFSRRWRAAAAEFASRAAIPASRGDLPKTRALAPADARKLAGELDAADAEFAAARAGAQKLLRFDDGAFHATPALTTVADVARVVAGWRGALPQLRDWTRYATARAAAEAQGLRPFLEAALRDRVPAAQWPDAAERSFLDAWIVRSLDGRPELKGFDARDHERRIAKFRADDRAWIAQNGPQLAHALRRAAAPASGSAVPDSEVGLLKRQSLLKRRHLSIRRLLAELPNLLPRLKPCLLMSPLSIAQYLPPSGRPFDVVVFDEASQITVPDAIGAVARGKQVVVVGDSHQLPPTSFFATQVGPGDGDGEGEGDDEELPASEEVESILDECVAANLPQLTLRWHYRSRHEQLIEFSNRHYYEGRLATFPSAWTDRGRFGVSLERVGGTFDRARSRTNEAEARAVVAWIVAALRDRDRCGRSIGVVTFNAPQRELILDLLDDARRAHPEIEPFFSDAAPEPVFVKNLENVQGDERDVMLFSITYGPDARGRVLMNFGPLNAEGGERRLNVAITRAREQLVVFSSLPADAIAPGRTRAIGVDHLRRFLHDVEQASAAPAVAAPSAARPGVGPLAGAVARALAADGVSVDGGVGASRMRVDLALKESGADHYFAGILCDGESYHAAETARDRDRLRDSVLESLGWRLAHVWSTEWMVDRERELARVRERVAALRRAAAPVSAAGANASLLLAPAGTAAAPPAATRGADGAAIPEPAAAPADASASAGSEASSPDAWSPFVPPVEPPRTPEQLGDADSAATLLATIVRAEGPLHEEPAFRTLAALHRIGRLTPAVADECSAVAAAAERQGVVMRRGEFLWPPELDPDDPPLRGPATDGRIRHAPHVPPEERAAAAARVLAANVALSRAELAKSAARLLGFARATDRVVTAFDEGVQQLLDRGRAVADGERVRLP